MTFLSAIILLGVIIFIHELGHFLFAKLLKVKVLKFSLGFGPKLLGKTYGDTEYLISAIPLGGYVKMLGENTEEELNEEDKPYAYNYQPVWKRATIVSAGPFFNLFFAVLLFIFIFFTGIPIPYPDIGEIKENSPAEKAGFLTGDRVIKINGEPVQCWDDIDNAINRNPDKTLIFKLKRGKEIIEIPVKPEKKHDKNIFGEDIEYWEIGISPLVDPVVGEVIKGEPAEKAGIKKGDRIIEINGTVIKTWQDITSIIHNSPEKPLTLKIKREDRIIKLSITPVRKPFKILGSKPREIGLIGIRPLSKNFIKKYNLLEALSLGIKKTWDISTLTLVVIMKIIQRIIPTDVIGGPILILQMAGEQASRGLWDFFFFMAVINVNLGILNLLPIPVLDGGHLFFLVIEAIKRKPLNEKFIALSQRIGIFILITIMAFAIYNDIMRLISGNTFP